MSKGIILFLVCWSFLILCQWISGPSYYIDAHDSDGHSIVWSQPYAVVSWIHYLFLVIVGLVLSGTDGWEKKYKTKMQIFFFVMIALIPLVELVWRMYFLGSLYFTDNGIPITSMFGTYALSSYIIGSFLVPLCTVIIMSLIHTSKKTS